MMASITWQPWFAVAGVLMISLPLWMHLYGRVASRRVPISSLRLVPQTPRIARARRRIKRWPLFLLRALGVVLLGLAFARPGPEDPAEISGGTREAVVFVLDRSGSMAMRSDEEQTAWEEAIQHLEDRLVGLHPQSRVLLCCFPPAKTGGDWITPSAMRKQLADLETSRLVGHPVDALREAAEALARFRSDMPETLEVVGDLQRQGWEAIDTLTLPGELQLRVHQVGSPDAPNRGLSLAVRGRDQLRRGVIVTLGGGAPLTVSDRSEADEDPVEQVHPLPDEILEVPYKATGDGWVKREIAFSQSSDGLPDDDRLFDTFFVSSEIPVYLIEPHPEREAFLQRTFFLQQALRPTAGVAAEDSRFRPKVIPIQEAVGTLLDLEEEELVVVVPAMATWPQGLPAAIEKVVRRGAGVLFFAGPDLQPQAFASAWRKVTPALPGGVLTLDNSLTLPPISEEHPLWGGLSEDARRSLRSVALDRCFALEPTQDAQVMASYSNEVPLVIERSIGDGRALFVNASADRAWGDWPADGALFVPSIHMLASAAVASTPQLLRNSPGAGVVGMPFDVRVDPNLSGMSLKAGERQVTVDEQGWVRGLLFAQPGLYDLETEDGAVVRPVAANFPPNESRREFISPGILDRQLAARRRAAGAGEDPPRINVVSESDWWRWILTILAIVWLAEAWLALGPRQATRIEESTT